LAMGKERGRVITLMKSSEAQGRSEAQQMGETTTGPNRKNLETPGENTGRTGGKELKAYLGSLGGKGEKKGQSLLKRESNVPGSVENKLSFEGKTNI